MDYNQGYPYEPSQPHPSYYNPYSYPHPHPHHVVSSASSAPSYYHHHPPPPGTAPAAPEASYYPANGMNPAAASAVAALTQLTEFASSMGASERAMAYPPHPQYPPPPQQHPTSVSGMGSLRGGRRGGGSSRGRGRGRGSFTDQHLMQDIGATSYRGRGRGRGRGGRGSGRQLAIHETAISSAGEAQSATASALAHMHDVGQVTITNTTRGRVLPVAWCDVCRVECNSKEILEQHKNGKRHKRTMQRMQEMSGLQGTMTPAIPEMATPASQVGGLPEASSELAEGNALSTAVHIVPPVGSSGVEHGGEVQEDLISENATAAVSGMNVPESTVDNYAQQNIAPCKMVLGNSVETQLEPQAANVQSLGARMDGSNRNGLKRKIVKSDRSGKKLILSDGPRQRPERVREQPMVCTLCNVTCNTRAVFDIHLGGKRHLSRLKRSQGADTIFGPLFLYIPPNQPVAHPLGSPDPVFYGLKSRSMIEQETYVLGEMQHKYPVLPPASEASMVGEGIQVATYAVPPMTGAMDVPEIGGPRAEQDGNGGLVIAALGTAAMEADVKQAPPPC